MASDDRPRCEHGVVFPLQNCIWCMQMELERLRAALADKPDPQYVVAGDPSVFAWRKQCQAAEAELERLQLENNQLHTECGHLQATVAEVQQARIDAAVEGSDYKAKWNACRALLREAVEGCDWNSWWTHHTISRDLAWKIQRAAGGSDGQ